MGQEPAGGTRRGGSLWVVTLGVAASVVAGLLADARAGALVLAGVLAIGAGIRAVHRGTAPDALGVRGRRVDVTVLALLAAALAILALLVPDP